MIQSDVICSRETGWWGSASCYARLMRTRQNVNGLEEEEEEE